MEDPVQESTKSIEAKEVKGRAAFYDLLDYAMRNIGHVTALYYSAKIQFEGHKNWRYANARLVERYIRNAFEHFGRITFIMAVKEKVEYYNDACEELNKAVIEYNQLVKILGQSIELKYGPIPDASNPLHEVEKNTDQGREILF